MGLATLPVLARYPHRPRPGPSTGGRGVCVLQAQCNPFFGFGLVVVILCPVLLAGYALAAAGQEMQPKVQALVQALEAGSDNRRADAEWSLLKLGPDALAFLPKAEPGRDRLAAVVATLEEMRPRTWTVNRTELTVDDALKRLKDQTKLTVRDLRQDKTIGRVTVDFQAATYWQVVQSLAQQTKARIALYQPDGQVALIDGPQLLLPVSLHGPFRTTVKRLSATNDLETGTHVCLVTLEIAWEPRFLPYLIEPGAASLTAGKDISKVPARAAVPVPEHNAREIELLFPAPPRSAKAIGELRGLFVVTTPIAQHRFEFKSPKVKTQKSTDGVQVTVNDIATESERWTVELTVDHPAAAPHFDSFQRWLGGKVWLDQTSCVFERGVGENLQVLRPDPLRTQIVSATAERVTVRFQFLKSNPAGLPLDNIENWKLVCRTPGRMVEMVVPYTFKDVPLP